MSFKKVFTNFICISFVFCLFLFFSTYSKADKFKEDIIPIPQEDINSTFQKIPDGQTSHLTRSFGCHNLNKLLYGKFDIPRSLSCNDLSYSFKNIK